ncbi:hypothetical protein [Taibaiella chishuiensis]|uniref:Lipoprotein n=1 Tax=Taibaiella chishuiensis TaxID=1434707 RepID=A0A2P8D398_9BACT|nr:hypothetical protein [Taibaiella chishuiensis]PSK91697.1 hypothetical protein B0I18_105282 [Taibaiella chishuiensis]
MKHFTSLLLGVGLSILGCNSTYRADEEANENYLRLKSEFDRSFTSQFPEKITTIVSSTVANTDIGQNRIGLYLYENGVPLQDLDSMVIHLEEKKTVKYKSSDTCLLVVNRFLDKYTVENGVRLSETDSLLINRDCYADMKPVPNFIKYKGHNLTDCGLDSTFDLFVLEAKAGQFFDEYKSLKPFIQMPENWKNGFSKGVAISRKNRKIIYWSIVW